MPQIHGAAPGCGVLRGDSGFLTWGLHQEPCFCTCQRPLGRGRQDEEDGWERGLTKMPPNPSVTGIKEASPPAALLTGLPAKQNFLLVSRKQTLEVTVQSDLARPLSAANLSQQHNHRRSQRGGTSTSCGGKILPT